MKRIIQITTIFCISILCLIGFRTDTYADSVTPAISEQVVLEGSTTNYTVSFKNESQIPENISPEVYAYDLQNQEILSSTSYIFIRIDKETYNVKPDETLSLRYEIVPPSNLEPGTYFNLIVFKKDIDTGFVTEKNSLDTTGMLSQLVVMHVSDSADTSVLGISSDYAQISMEIVDNGIPFLKPMRIKYTYQNTSNYVLTPDGEIQVFDTKSSYPPIYTKINEEGKRLFPNEVLEETVSVGSWNISDILFGRKVIGRFYNGIDQQSQSIEDTANTYYIYIIGVATIFVLIGVFVKSLSSDRKRSR